MDHNLSVGRDDPQFKKTDLLLAISAGSGTCTALAHCSKLGVWFLLDICLQWSPNYIRNMTTFREKWGLFLFCLFTFLFLPQVGGERVSGEEPWTFFSWLTFHVVLTRWLMAWEGLWLEAVTVMAEILAPDEHLSSHPHRHPVRWGSSLPPFTDEN